MVTKSSNFLLGVVCTNCRFHVKFNQLEYLDHWLDLYIMKGKRFVAQGKRMERPKEWK